MLPVTAADSPANRVRERAAALFDASLERIARHADRLFIGLLLFEWAAGLAAALWLSPRTWVGSTSAIHPHVWTALGTGTLAVAFPIACALLRPGSVLTRHAIATGQMLTGGLLIQYTGGRIETHFIVFGSLAFVTFYRDWRVLMTASVVVAIDHVVRGLFWPESVYGVFSPTLWRSLEHTGWVVFIDVFLFAACRQGVRELHEVAERRAELEETNRGVERQVQSRTEELRASEGRFRSLCAAAPIGISQTDAAGQIVYTNPALQRLAELSAEEFLGEGWRAVVHPDELAEVAEEWALAVAAGRPFHREARMQRKSGEIRWVATRTCPVLDESGRAVGHVATFEDFTERRDAAQNLRAAKDDAEAANRAKSAFLATMSHEIRTPMNGVIGMTTLLLDTEMRSEQREIARTIRSCGESLLQIINDILDFSKIEASKMQIDAVDFDVRAMIEEALEPLAERAHSRGLELACVVEHDVPDALQGDPGRLRQILTNLAGNAIKFTEIGEVVVRAKVVRAIADGRVVLRVDVTDTGIGVPADVQSKLFMPFSQADDSTTRRFGGTGLGLAICRQLAELMGGEVGLESVEGRGSTFWFTAALRPASKAPAPPAPPRSLHGVRLLLVDDNTTNLQILRSQTSAWGMQVETATNGRDALALLHGGALHGRPFEIAILDLMMPEMDGIELGRVIRANSSLASLQLVLLTSATSLGQARRSREAGFQAFLTKPVREKHLCECLRLLVGSSALEVPRDDSRILTRHTLRESEIGSRPRILVVEDNEVNQVVAVRTLERLGYSADVAANGARGVEAHARGAYDAILMDCLMPEMDGFESTRAIRRAEAKRGVRTPIIAMTANAMQGDREKCLDAGMDDYVSKPISRADLGAALARWVRKPAEAQPKST